MTERTERTLEKTRLDNGSRAITLWESILPLLRHTSCRERTGAMIRNLANVSKTSFPGESDGNNQISASRDSLLIFAINPGPMSFRKRSISRNKCVCVERNV